VQRAALIAALLAFASFVTLIGGAQVAAAFSPEHEGLADTVNGLEPRCLVNPYGPISMITLERPETIVEGSNDESR
jgi:hypothetical protein